MLHLKKYSYVAMLLLLVAPAVQAQQALPPLSLKALLQRVDQKAPALIADSAAINIRRAQATETRNNWLPNLKLNYQADIGTNNNTAGPYFGFGIIPSNSRGVRTDNNTNAVLTNLGIAALDWEVYNFGAYTAQNKVAKSDIQVEQNHFAQSKYQLQAYAIGYYMQLMRLQDYLAIQVRNIQRTSQIRRSIESLAKSGIRPGVDTSIAAAELSKARLNYIELDNQLKQVQLQLSAISGLPYQAIIPDTSAEKRLIDGVTLSMLPSADTANHPLISYYKSLLQNSFQREELVKKQYNPKILLEAAAWGRGASVDANDQFNALSSGFGFNRDNYLVGVGISYNLFDLRRRHLKLRTQQAETDYARRSLDEQRSLLNLGISQADVELTTAKQRLVEIPNQLRAANAGYRQKLSLYNSGLTDIIDLNAALNILYRAETDYAQAKFDYTSALFQKAVTGNQLSTVLNLLN
ncbi:TolC family protein [Mucilaginibacter paludis]|uniref:Outer membrane efflux protein n=1 Tax=Mucilaginibacter paludis DSM 18603 TaxID=714943 RepID=H1YBG0_9SPHI|nr:TolC family protein [Mucilaginibacter paludis]EHQ25031.1 outer membrane efflux protein [Mucilaginibacter paludis DSM 18603]